MHKTIEKIIDNHKNGLSLIDGLNTSDEVLDSILYFVWEVDLEDPVEYAAYDIVCKAYNQLVGEESLAEYEPDDHDEFDFTGL